ncbi:hypothetical protein K3495_g11212 [Podosphaera aphanis]|nr:hypothetical protein K3495_g11212 [Podosphaera aphanis]
MYTDDKRSVKSQSHDDNNSLDGNEEKMMTSEELEVATKTMILAYMNERMKDYDIHGLKGIELFEYWKSDFENFNATAYKKTTEGTRILRDFLRKNGVYIPKNRKSIADNLIVSAKAWTPWPIDSYNHNPIANQSLQNIPSNLQPTSNPIDNLPSTSEKGFNKPITPTLEPSNNDEPKHETARYTTSNLISLSTIYTESQKYCGEGGSFDFKYGIFIDLYEKVDIPREEYFKAFCTMLTGTALRHYYTSIKPNPRITQFPEICKSIRQTFEGPEFKRNMSTRWNNLTFQTIIDDNSSKSIETCLQLLIDELRTTQMSLPRNFQGDASLQNKLLTAC